MRPITARVVLTRCEISSAEAIEGSTGRLSVKGRARAGSRSRRTGAGRAYPLGGPLDDADERHPRLNAGPVGDVRDDTLSCGRQLILQGRRGSLERRDTASPKSTRRASHARDAPGLPLVLRSTPPTPSLARIAGLTTALRARAEREAGSNRGRRLRERLVHLRSISAHSAHAANGDACTLLGCRSVVERHSGIHDLVGPVPRAARVTNRYPPAPDRLRRYPIIPACTRGDGPVAPTVHGAHDSRLVRRTAVERLAPAFGGGPGTAVALSALSEEPTTYAREGPSLLRLHPMKLWRLIQAGEIRAFKQTFFTRPPGSARAFKHERLFVSSRAINDYMARKEALYQAEAGRRRQCRAVVSP